MKSGVVVSVVSNHDRARGQEPRRVSVLGATGSIGTSALKVMRHHRETFELVAVTAQSQVAQLAKIARENGAEFAAIGDEARLPELREALAGTGIRCAGGEAGLMEAAALDADCTIAAIVGAAGLKPTLEAVRQGTRIALANKECLVTAGDMFMAAIRENGTELLPVDSEHSAVFQALAGSRREDVETITLTASGGPFRTWSFEALARATPEQALKHPNWSMGSKITIDSATMMNKGLELIEAKHIFDVPASALDCVVHPESVVHCLVGFRDGSVMAQMAPPDMCTPIAVALGWPARIANPTERLDIARVAALHFEPPDESRFPALRLAREALEKGGIAPAILNAANEIAVAAFLDHRLRFTDIPSVVADALEASEKSLQSSNLDNLDDVLFIDAEARKLARSSLNRYE